jgi:hypothetical protein
MNTRVAKKELRVEEASISLWYAWINIRGAKKELREEEACISLRRAWMNMHVAKDKFHSCVDSNIDETNITNYIAGISDTIVDSDGYRPTGVCTL